MKDWTLCLTRIGEGYIVKLQITLSFCLSNPIFIWIDRNRHIHDFLQTMTGDSCPWVHGKEIS